MVSSGRRLERCDSSLLVAVGAEILPSMYSSGHLPPTASPRFLAVQVALHTIVVLFSEFPQPLLSSMANAAVEHQFRQRDRAQRWICLQSTAFTSWEIPTGSRQANGNFGFDLNLVPAGSSKLLSEDPLTRHQLTFA